MVTNGPYRSLDVARRLHLLGDWDLALAVLDGQSGTAELELRAEIHYDKFFWRMEGLEAAAAAISALDPSSVQFQYLTARLAYSRLLFQIEPLPDDYDTSEAGYRVVAADPTLHGWGEFHWGVLADNVGEDSAAAMAHYEKAFESCRRNGDLVLESYVIRHMAGQAFDSGDSTEGLRMLRRSLHLRSTSGMRPQTAAAQLALARELPEGDAERATLVEASRTVADELRLAWVQQGLRDM
jgi:hypothetical protein